MAVISYLSTKRLRAGILTALAAALSVPTWAQVSACDLNSDGGVNILDVNRVVSMVLGQATCTANLNGPGVCNIITVQRVVNASLGQPCVADSSAVAGLVAAYSFSEGSGATVADASGNGNTGTIVNATWTNSGKYGNALAFNESNARVDISDSTSLRLSSGMTLEAWVQPSIVNSTWRDVVYKGNDNYYLAGTSPNGSLPAVGATGGTTIYGNSALTVNTWAHLAATYDGANLRLYLNGIQVANQARTVNLTTSANPLQIGGDTIFGQYFSGLIDEVRVYNRALTQTEIQTDMNTPVGPTTPDTQAPTTPGSLSGSVISGTQINLGWTASTDNIAVTGYRLERCQGAGCSNFVEIATPSGTAYNDSSLLPSTTYSYRVRATDAAGNLSSYSNVATATTTLSISHSVTLSWVASTTPSVSYNVYRSTTSGGPYTKINGSLIAGLSYVDNSVVAGQTYFYVGTAVDNGGNESAYSTQATAVIPTQ